MHTLSPKTDLPEDETVLMQSFSTLQKKDMSLTHARLYYDEEF